MQHFLTTAQKLCNINHSESEKFLACNVIGFKNYRISYDLELEYERYFQNYEGQ